jgi:ATP-dependent DNA helicase RecG
MADLGTPLAKLLGGPTAKKLAGARDLHTVGDLLGFLPRRYLDPATTTDLSTLQEGEYTVLVATVKTATTRPMRQRRGMMLTVTVTDGSNDMTLTFFKPYGHEQRLVPGRTGLFAGKVQRYRSTWQLAHPNYELFDSDDTDAALGVYAGGLVPIYLHVPKLDSWAITKSMRIVLDHLDDVDDPVPAAVRRERGLVSLLEAYRLVHLPTGRRDVRRGEHRLRYDEAFTVQAVLAQRRRANEDVRTTPRRPRPGGLLESFDKRLPFELTAGQVAVSEQIAAELALEHPMHRLLQGEVGSGKTIVALRAMLSVIDSGGQAALLAPTEVLAAQHVRSIRAMLGDLAQGGMLGGSEVGTQVALLTGSQPTAVRRKALLDAASGAAGIVIGTHALIQEHVSFFDLGLVVVDEQHRFGVEQREALRSKGSQPPHVLVMTATPIPRTVAMTVFGDMETSTLTELPRGRSPIASHVVPGVNPRWVQRTWQRVAEEVRQGHQAYVVCPRIGDDGQETGAAASGRGAAGVGGASGGPEDGAEEDWLPTGPEDEDGAAGGSQRELRSVLGVVQDLRAEPALDGVRIEVLHGRMAAEDKDVVMRAFAAGEIDLLVSTTVIEVGVDVPNATVMVIVDAERFGVSQLHQLRGRVGRGQAPGLCLLMTDAEPGPSLERLEAVAATTDGFALARLDLEQRREGDVLGARQSGGRSQLRLLRLLRDEDLILQAREDAFAVVSDDPTLEQHPVLRELVSSALDEEQAAYLERG